MDKLLQNFEANPTTQNAARVRKYDYKHPFSSMALSAEQHATLAAAKLLK